MRKVAAQFLFDFGSPNAYMCHRVLRDIEWRTGIRIEYVPILLGGLFKLTNNRSPAEAFADIPNKRAYDALEVQRFLAKHKLSSFRRNEFFPVNTLLIMRGAVAAQVLGCFDAYVEAVFSCMWEQSLNMADLDIARGALSAAGLDAEAILKATQDAGVKERLSSNTHDAFARGAFGSPTFFVGDELFFGKDRLREVEEEILKQKAG
ncbi:2-hydroxychromene-2-carboxylate isomerase [Variovorax saccharolyticus]|uniref:2-hydroxychromene-2-carboxylate isomerase n=1 Tax=Variovorax saccharolyticus TaxID=3053516 RepID=UPI002576100C|nr:2-hydroxychromene-2-carboxylate isomerase [Variovorax sp. J22R187]MDM0021234.1 2-hydroxychromene-2-carboxylate isomerase [Variovorax sp. J22R187]